MFSGRFITKQSINYWRNQTARRWWSVTDDSLDKNQVEGNSWSLLSTHSHSHTHTRHQEVRSTKPHLRLNTTSASGTHAPTHTRPHTHDETSSSAFNNFGWSPPRQGSEPPRALTRLTVVAEGNITRLIFTFLALTAQLMKFVLPQAADLNLHHHHHCPVD